MVVASSFAHRPQHLEVYLKVTSSIGVISCCRGLAPLELLDGVRGLEDVLNSSRMKKFRDSLLTGNLEDMCRTCNIRKWTTIEMLEFKVSLLTAFGGVLPILHRLGILLPIYYRLR